MDSVKTNIVSVSTLLLFDTEKNEIAKNKNIWQYWIKSGCKEEGVWTIMKIYLEVYHWMW